MKEFSKDTGTLKEFILKVFKDTSFFRGFFHHFTWHLIVWPVMLVLSYLLSTQLHSKHLLPLALLLVAAIVGMLIFRYLSGTSSSIRQALLDRDKFYEEIAQHLSELKTELNLLASDKKDELITLLVQRLKAEASDNFLSDLKLQIKKDEMQLNLGERGQTTLSRIYDEIDALSRRGNINLVLGVMMALGGVAVLAYFVFNDGRPHEDVAGFAISFLPRLSIVIIIEVFSFFFLKLYKASLSEIKYFQNEATNIEFHFAALEIAIHLGDAKLFEKAMDKFTSVERNPILKNNDMTRELKSEIASERGIKLSPEYFAEILRIISPNNRENKPEK